MKLKKISNPYICEVELPKGYEDQYPFKNGDNVLMLGEIKHMPGHCAVVTKDGIVHWAYHTDNFRELTQEEV